MNGPIRLKLYCSCSVPESEFYSLYYYVRDSSVGRGRKKKKKEEKKKDLLKYSMFMVPCIIIYSMK